MTIKPHTTHTSIAGDSWLELVHAYARQFRYGTIVVTIHDAHVVQIDATERVRLSPAQAIRDDRYHTE